MRICSLGPLARSHSGQSSKTQTSAGNGGAIYAFHVSVQCVNILVKSGPFKNVSSFWTGSRANNWHL